MLPKAPHAQAKAARSTPAPDELPGSVPEQEATSKAVQQAAKAGTTLAKAVLQKRSKDEVVDLVVDRALELRQHLHDAIDPLRERACDGRDATLGRAVLVPREPAQGGFEHAARRAVGQHVGTEPTPVLRQDGVRHKTHGRALSEALAAPIGPMTAEAGDVRGTTIRNMLEEVPASRAAHRQPYARLQGHEVDAVPRQKAVVRARAVRLKA